MPENAMTGSSAARPKPEIPESLEIGRERWQAAIARAGDQHLESAARELAANGRISALLDTVFTHSPFLTQSAAADATYTIDLLRDGPDAALARVLADISARPDGETEAQLKQRLRIAKRRAALAIAFADISGDWPLEKITEGLSDVADACLQASARFALSDAARRGGLILADGGDPVEGSGLVILGMGKLGARELNYSSDIDIVVLFDPEIVRTDKPEDLQTTMVRLTRLMIRIMDERTADGYVFRTDVRLRPDPGATPVAISTLAAETYYESLGQNWERAAFIKARPAAGDLAAGARFLDWLKPFVWRKSLDFAAIQDIHSIKRQINAHRRIGGIKALGHNVKLGGGGIREIEFFAQTQQLIWGGRIPDLRLRRTKDAIDALVLHGQVDRETADDLKAAYDFLRRVEHRLQMVNDEQTHSLPSDQDAFATIAGFLGYDGADAFAADLTAHLEKVSDHYSELFGDAPALSAKGEISGNLVFTGTDADPDTLETLTSLGFREAARVDAVIRGWHHGRYRAMRSTRARELLTELTPVLLDAIAGMPDPDDAFMRFDGFLRALPAGVQLFSMFHSRPELLSLVVELTGKAPRLARHMGAHANVLDVVLTADFHDPPPDLAEMTEELERTLGACADMEDTLLAVRRWANDRRFQVGVQQLGGTIAPGAAAAALSDIAEAALGGLLPRVIAEFEETHGRLPGGELAIVAMGRLGSREMTAASDLDLIFVYDIGDPDAPSDGAKPLPPIQYFARLTQRAITAITAMTPEGTLYEVDMRLRPSGTKGPIATSLAAFRRYHAESAWTWERLALVRARAVAGAPALRGKVEDAISSILAEPVDAKKLLADVAHMRARLADSKKAQTIWDIKNQRGGLVDIAFLAQYLTLRHAKEHPEVRHANTRRTLENLKAAGLLDQATADTLLAAQDLWTGLLGMLALTMEGDVTADREAQISGALAGDLARVGGADDFAGLKRKVKATAKAVYEIFQEIIETPAAALPPADGPNPEKETLT